MRTNQRWHFLTFTPPASAAPADVAPSPGPMPRAEVKALVVAALKADAYSVAELAAFVGADTDVIRSVIVTLRKHLEIVAIQRQSRRGRVYGNVYRYRRGGPLAAL